MFIKILMLVGAAAAVLCCNASAGAEAELLGVKVERNVPVPMRDGVILRADVHRPDRGGPYPVLVKRTPYGKEGSFNVFVKAGYIVVSQDVRGRYESEGKFESMWRSKTHDAEDGYDTVEWAARLPGSTGKVGTFGGSYDAFLQWRLAPLRPPSLAAMAAFSIPAQIWYGENPCTVRPGFRLEWWAMMAVDMRRRENLPGVHTDWEHQILWKEEEQKWLDWCPWLELPEDFYGYETNSVKSWLKNPRVDPWKLDKGCNDVSVPNLDIVGWYDHANGDMLLFRTMVREAYTKVARAGSRIIIGPWTHGRVSRRFGNIDFGPDAEINRADLQIRWFDYWLKGKQNGLDKEPPVRLFVMGDNTWRDEPHWPLERTKDRILYLTSDGHANTANGDGRLVADKSLSGGTDKYVYDPNNPVPAPYGAQRPIPADQRPLAKREDILVYWTEPLAERVEVTGNPVVDLYAASSAPDTDWFMRLVDVAPDGLARDVSMGVLRAQYRDGFDKSKLIKPGKVIKYAIRMSPTSNAFLPGHRIRLDITSSDFPNYDRNHNTAFNQNADAALAIAEQAICHGGRHATRIILPWVPNQKVDGSRQRQPTASMATLHQAAAGGDIETVKSVISKGVDANSKDKKGKTPLHYAAEAGKIEIVQLLVEAGADVNAMGKNDWPPLCIAAGNSSILVAEYLIAHGADVNPDNGWTPLQEAPYSNSIEMVKLLIAKGADINAGPWTALHGAVEQRRKDIAEVLIKEGADVNAKDEDGFQPLYYALGNKDLDTAKLLIGSDADIHTEKDPRVYTYLHWAAINGMKEIAELLIAKGLNIHAKNDSGCTPLHLAASAGHRDIAELLLAKGAKVNEEDNEYEFTALHYAARFGHKEVAELLISHGANVNIKDKWDYQPIHVAAYHDRSAVVELFLAKGADVDAKTSLGETPLQLAQRRRNKETIELVRKHGGKE